jgi:hypothetical protein
MMRLVCAVLGLWCAGCTQEALIHPSGPGLGAGTWGGENAGVLVQDSTAHVHVGCTNGYFPRATSLDGDGRFSVDGSYVLRAYPVQMGPDLPAKLEGVIAGSRLTFSVIVNDTVEDKTVTVGPAVVFFDREPAMQNCPICAISAMMR